MADRYGRSSVCRRAGVVTLVAASLVLVVFRASPASAKATIVVVPQVSVSDASLVQGSTGDPSLTFDVTLSQAATQAVTVDYQTVEGWPTFDPTVATGVASEQDAGQYVSVTPQLVTIAKGKTEKSITVDTLSTAPATVAAWFTVMLSNPSGATMEDAEGTGTILPPSTGSGFSVGIGDTSIREPATGSETADMTVSFSGPAPKKFTLTAATTSAATADFSSTKETVTVNAKAKSATIPVTVLANPANKSSAAISVKLSSSLGTVGRANGTVLVRGDSITSTRTGRWPGPPRVSLLGDSITSNYSLYVKAALEARGYAVFNNGVAGSSILDANECHGQEATSVVATQDPDIAVFENGGNYGFFPPCDPSVAGLSPTFWADWKAAAIADTGILQSKGAAVYWVLDPGFVTPAYSIEEPVLNADYLAIAASTPNVYTIDAWTPFGGATPNLSLRAYDFVHLNVAGDQLITSVISSSIPASAPSAPLSPAATAGNGSSVVSWGTPASNGSAITSYTVASYDMTTAAWGPIVSGSGNSVTVPGLKNGDTFLFAVTATNLKGTSPAAIVWSATVPTTVPDAPTSVSATAGNGSAAVSWIAPSANGSPITGYTVTATDTTTPGNGGQSATSTGGPVTLSGLTNGDSYTFSVTATNARGTGAASAPSDPVVPTTVPGTPTSVVAAPGNGSAAVSWIAPSANGSPITGYTVTATDTTNPGNGGQTATSATSSATVTGLSNGDSYTFSVTATNGQGTGDPSDPSAPVLLATAPDSPTEVLAAPDAADDPGTLSVYFYPGFDEGSAITGYTVTITDLSNPSDPNNGLTVLGSGSPVTVGGLTSGDLYSFTVTATNAIGTSDPSDPSDGVAAS